MNIPGSSRGGLGTGIGQLSQGLCEARYVEEAPKQSEVLTQFENMDKCLARLEDMVNSIDRRTQPVRLSSPQPCGPETNKAETAKSGIEQAIFDRYQNIDRMADQLAAVLRELRI